LVYDYYDLLKLKMINEKGEIKEKA